MTLTRHHKHAVRRVTAITALGAFLLIVVMLSFGFHMMDGGRSCLLDELQNTSCIGMNSAEMVASHTNALSRFIGGVLLPTLFLLAITIFFISTVSALTASTRERLSISSIPDHGPPPILTQFTHWLARLVDSPPSLILGRA